MAFTPPIRDDWLSALETGNYVGRYRPNMVASASEVDSREGEHVATGTAGLRTLEEGRIGTRICGYASRTHPVAGVVAAQAALGKKSAPAEVKISFDTTAGTWKLTSDKGSLQAIMDLASLWAVTDGTTSAFPKVKCKELEIVGNFDTQGVQDKLSAAIAPGATVVPVDQISKFQTQGMAVIGDVGIGNALDGAMLITWNGKSGGALQNVTGVTKDFGEGTAIAVPIDTTDVENCSPRSPRAYLSDTARFVEPTGLLRGASQDINRLAAGETNGGRASLVLGGVTYLYKMWGTGPNGKMKMQHIKAAQLETNFSGNNADLRFVSRTSGGTGITIALVNPGAANPENVVDVLGNAITVTLKHNGTNVTAQADKVKDAIDDHAQARELVQVFLVGNGEGTIPNTGFPQTNLSLNNCVLKSSVERFRDPDGGKFIYDWGRNGTVYLATDGSGNITTTKGQVEAEWAGNGIVEASVPTPNEGDLMVESAQQTFAGGTAGTLNITAAAAADFQAKMPNGGELDIHMHGMIFTGVDTTAGQEKLLGVEARYISNSNPLSLGEYHPTDDSLHRKILMGPGIRVIGVQPSWLGKSNNDNWGQWKTSKCTGSPRDILQVYPSGHPSNEVARNYKFKPKNCVAKYMTGGDFFKVQAHNQDYGREDCCNHYHPGVEFGAVGTHIDFMQMPSCRNFDSSFRIKREFLPWGRTYINSPGTEVSRGVVWEDSVIHYGRFMVGTIWLYLNESQFCGGINNWVSRQAFSERGGTPTPTDLQHEVFRVGSPADDPIRPKSTDPWETWNKWDDGSLLNVGTPAPGFVQGTDPVDGATGVDKNANQVINFNQPMDQSTLVAANLELRDSQGALVARTIQGVTSTSATINPDAALSDGLQYTIRVIGGPNGVQNASDQTMDSDYTSSFTVQPAPPAPPNVIGKDPDAGESNVDVETTILIDFDVDMDIPTFAGITVTGPEGQIEVDSSTSTIRQAVIDPAVSLDPETLYTVNVPVTVENIANTPLVAPVSWSFSTAGLPEPEDPPSGIGLFLPRLRGDASGGGF